MNIALEKYRYYFETILENPLFANVPTSSVKDLLQITENRYCHRGTCVLDTHEISHRFFIIMSGKIKAYVFDPTTDRQFTLDLLTVHDVFDLIALFGGITHKVYYQTLEPTELLCLPVASMKQWLEKNQSMHSTLLLHMVKRLHAVENKVTNIVMDDIPTRLAKLLYANMNSQTNNVEFINNLSHEELAALIGTTRSVLNRHINNFSNLGLIKVNRKRIRIADIQNLQAIIRKSQT